MRKIGPLVVLIPAILSGFSIVARPGSTCDVCRLWRRDVSLGLTRTAYHATGCNF